MKTHSHEPRDHCVHLALRQGCSNGICSPMGVLRFWLCFASHFWHIALELLHQGCDLNVRICMKHCVFSVEWRLRCGEKLARLSDGVRLGVGALPWNLSRTARAVELRVPGDFPLLFWRCAIVFHMCWDTLCIGTGEFIVLCNSVCADRSGMAAPRLLECYSFSSRVLRFWLCFASHFWHIALELLHQGCDLNVRICMKHCVFSVEWRLRCGEKLARLSDGVRLGVGALPWNLSRTARAVELRVPGDFSSSFLTLCYCVLHV